LEEGLHRIAFFIVPSSMAFIALGDIIAAVLYQTGRFTASDSDFVWAILAGSSVGLLASTLGRLYSSTFYALNDTRTPLRFAVLRVALTTILGYLCALKLPVLIGVEPKWGVAGLTASSGVAGWLEFILLRRSLNRRIGRTGLSSSFAMKLWFAAGVGAGIGWGLRLLLGTRHPLIMAIVVLGGYGSTYFAITSLFGIGEAQRVINKVFRLVRIR
jgi:putative peptidoglycan lipid II flippase